MYTLQAIDEKTKTIVFEDKAEKIIDFIKKYDLSSRQYAHLTIKQLNQ